MIEAETMDGTMEGDREEGGKIQLNPFLQPPILKALFEQLPMKDLTKCRLVNKLWYEESLSIWRSNVTLKFGREGIVSTRDDGSSSVTSLGEFLDLWDAGEWGHFPFTKFSLRNFWLEAGNVEQERFLELVGGHITSLTLEYCTFVGRGNFRRIIYAAFPKLQFLTFQFCNVHIHNDDCPIRHERTEDIELWDVNCLSSEYKEPAFGVHGLNSLELSYCCPGPDSIMHMLSHFHKIKTLSMTTAADQEDYRNLLEAIKLIRAQDQTKLPLKNFNVDFKLYLGDGDERPTTSMELLKLHEQINLPLQRLLIWFVGEEDVDYIFNNADVIRKILQCHSSTLKHLEAGKITYQIYRNDRHPQRLCKLFPVGFQFEKLEELILPSRSSDNLNYLMYMPNLRILNIWNEGGDSLSMSESDNLFANSSQLEIGDWTLPSLTDLKFEVPLSPCNLRKLMKRMPNVERLWGMKLNDVKFWSVCENWKHLKELVDYGRELTDEGVIGIENALEAGGGEETRSCSNITKLKSLTSFETCSSNLTSASVHEGFLKLASLRELKMGQFTWIGKEAIAAVERQEISLEFSNWRLEWE